MKIIINDFLKGIASLVVSQILIKIFGLIYSLYLTNKTGFGDKGNAIYMSGYQIYALLLTISSIGVPNAISKLISEKKSIADYVNEDRIFKVSIFIFSLIGFIGSVCLYIFSGCISKIVLQIPEAELSLKVLSPAVFFVSVSSVFRGYYNGENKIFITAKSQIYEQISKSMLTIIFVEIISKLSNSNTEIMAAIANFSTTVATLVSLMYMIIKYYKYRIKIFSRQKFPKERIIKILKNILNISIPITIGAILSSLCKNIDSITVVRILKDLIGEREAIKRYGILSSKVDILIALPLSFNIAISTALIPEISRRKAKNDIIGIAQKIEESLKMTAIIGIPCTVGIFFYSKQILNLLYPNANGGWELLRLASINVIFSLLLQTITGILQGLGKSKIPLYASIVGIIVKIFSNIILIPNENLYEKGAIIGNILFNLVSFAMVYYSLRKNLKMKKIIIRISIIPLISSILMIIVSLNLYNFLIENNIKEYICTIISILVAVIIYFFILSISRINEIYEKVKKTWNY